jgi:excisionase family DNA binding protein
MEPLFYSTGQVARQLGTTLAAVRTLCENRVIAAETTPGGHWRVPASEVERLQRDGLPPIPRPLPTENAPPASNGTTSRHGQPELLAGPSDEVALSDRGYQGVTEYRGPILISPIFIYLRQYDLQTADVPFDQT